MKLFTFTLAYILPLALALKCGEGEIAGQATTKQSYSASLPDVVRVVNSFHKAEWAGLLIVGTTGTDNGRNARRNLTIGSTILTERLTAFEMSPSSLTMEWSLEEGPYRLDLPNDGGNIFLRSYEEELEVGTACDGKASQAEWKVEYCFSGGSPQAGAVQKVFEGLHARGLKNVAANLGAPEFVSCATPDAKAVVSTAGTNTTTAESSKTSVVGGAAGRTTMSWVAISAIAAAFGLAFAA